LCCQALRVALGAADHSRDLGRSPAGVVAREDADLPHARLLLTHRRHGGDTTPSGVTTAMAYD
jgi:hypothetical protein